MGKGTPRRSEAEVDIRRGDVEEHMARCDWNTGSRARLMERWGIGRHQLWRDYHAVMDSWGEQARLDQKDPQPELLAQMRELQRMAMANILAFPTAAKMLVERGKMTGAYPTQKLEVEHSGSVDVNIKAPDEQGRNIFRALAVACQVIPPEEARGYLEAALAELPVSTVIDVEAEP